MLVQHYILSSIIPIVIDWIDQSRKEPSPNLPRYLHNDTMEFISIQLSTIIIPYLISLPYLKIAAEF